MKKSIILFFCLFSMGVFAQTDGFYYQAVIIDQNAQELPGANAEGTILANEEVSLRFSIVDFSGTIEYRELQDVRTDAFGMINVLIGSGRTTVGLFTDIDWTANIKRLEVDIKSKGNFEALETKELTYLPYAFHREVIATGTMNVEGEVRFTSDLIVEGVTNLNSDLSVNNASATELSGKLKVDLETSLNNLNVNNGSRTGLSGSLNVDGATTLRDRLNVEDSTYLKDRLIVGGDTRLRSNLDVEETTTLNDDVSVRGQNPTLLTGTMTVGGETNFNSDVNINNNSNLDISGGMNVGGATILEQDLTVNGNTNLNNDLSVNNQAPTNLSGSLEVGGQTTLNFGLQVIGDTDLENLFRVNNVSSTELSGTLEVGLATNLNSGLSVNGDNSLTYLSGPLNVNGLIDFGNELTVGGITNLNDALFVNNGVATNFSGDLNIGGNTNFGNLLSVGSAATFNNDLSVINNSPSNLSGTLEVDNSTTLNSSLTVANQSATSLNGTLTVDGETNIGNTLEVTNASSSNFSGVLGVDGITQLEDGLSVTGGSTTMLSGNLTVDQETSLNDLSVLNGVKSSFTGTLNVQGTTNLNSLLTINNSTLIDNDLTVTGAASLTSISTGGITVSSDRPDFIASFSNLNDEDGDGLEIKLGRNHGRWTGSGIFTINQFLVSNDPYDSQNPTDPDYVNAFVTIKDQFVAGGNFSVNEIISLTPVAVRLASIGNINNLIFGEVQAQVNLPKNLPSVTQPAYTVPGFETEIVFFGGLNPICSGQYCYSVCFPFAGCITVCVPPVNVCVPRIPKIAFPALSVPQVNIAAQFSNYLPQLPSLSDAGLLDVSLPDIPTTPFANSLTKENEYVTFLDTDDRKTGTIRAQSIVDFLDNTLLDDVYMFNVMSAFIAIDPSDIAAESGKAVLNLINEFNKLGVEYSSGNGDYAEWLEREHLSEYITAGDIVAVNGGKITKDISSFEQLLVVSHKPIVLGNNPEKGKELLGNTVAFIGQVPVKILGPVTSGDYIIASEIIPGYGKAVSPDKMTSKKHLLAVGRSWETNTNEGPKAVLMVIGLQNGDFKNEIDSLEDRQEVMDTNLEDIQSRLQRIEKLLETSSEKTTYATKE